MAKGKRRSKMFIGERYINMMGTKDNSNLDEMFKNEYNKKNRIGYEKTITTKDKGRLVKAIVNMHDKLGADRFNLVAEIVVVAAKNKKQKGEKFEFKDLERVLKKAIEMVNEI